MSDNDDPLSRLLGSYLQDRDADSDLSYSSSAGSSEDEHQPAIPEVLVNKEAAEEDEGEGEVDLSWVTRTNRRKRTKKWTRGDEIDHLRQGLFTYNLQRDDQFIEYQYYQNLLHHFDWPEARPFRPPQEHDLLPKGKPNEGTLPIVDEISEDDEEEEGDSKATVLVRCLPPEVDAIQVGLFNYDDILCYMNPGPDFVMPTSARLRLHLNGMLIRMATKLICATIEYPAQILPEGSLRSIKLRGLQPEIRRYALAKSILFHERLFKPPEERDIVFEQQGQKYRASCKECGLSKFTHRRVADFVIHCELAHDVRLRNWAELMHYTKLLPYQPTPEEDKVRSFRLGRTTVRLTSVNTMHSKHQAPYQVWAAAYAVGFHHEAIQRAIQRFNDIVTKNIAAHDS